MKKLKAKNQQAELKFAKAKFEATLANFQRDSSPEIKLRLQDINELLKTV